MPEGQGQSWELPVTCACLPVYLGPKERPGDPIPYLIFLEATAQPKLADPPILND